MKGRVLSLRNLGQEDAFATSFTPVNVYHAPSTYQTLFQAPDIKVANKTERNPLPPGVNSLAVSEETPPAT